MNIGTLLLAIWLFFKGAEDLGWFTVNPQVTGFIAVLAAVFMLIGGLGVFNYTFPTIRRNG